LTQPQPNVTQKGLARALASNIQAPGLLHGVVTQPSIHDEKIEKTHLETEETALEAALQTTKQKIN